jgi:hypothetical protein
VVVGFSGCMEEVSVKFEPLTLWEDNKRKNPTRHKMAKTYQFTLKHPVFLGQEMKDLLIELFVKRDS